MVELPGEDAAKEVIREAGKQNGALGIIAIILILAMIGGLAYVASALIPVAQRFIESAAISTESNAEAISAMNKSMETVHQAHAAMMQSSVVTQDGIKSNGHKIELLIESIDQMAGLIDDAKIMMAKVPEQREQQTKLLQQIDEAIRQLAVELRKDPP